MADYAISNVPRRVVYAASGVGPYAFTFEILVNTDVAVYKDDALLTLSTDYTVSIAANGTGTVTLTALPTGATQIAIVGSRAIQRTSDFVTGGDFFANTVNDELDSLTIFAQQNAEGLARALQAPQTDPLGIDMTLPRASVRANKTLAFDSNGNPIIGEVIGDNRGDWAAGTAYNKRDIVRDAVNGNVYYANTAHTSSGVAPIDDNADAGKWDLLVDNGSAVASATAAAASATNAATSASTATTQASNASTSATAAASSASSALASKTAAEAAASTAAADAVAAADALLDAAVATATAAAAGSASAASTSASNAATSATSALASLNSFKGQYYGPASSDPSVDPLGNAPTAGDLYFNTTTNRLRVFNGTTSTWVEGSSGSVAVQNFNGTGSQTAFTMASAPESENNTQVYISGVYQQKDQYSISGATLTFTSAPPAGTNNIEVVTLNTLPLGVTSADLVQFQPAGAGAVLRTVDAKLQEAVSVKDFGAVGDGVTDDTVAIQGAINYVTTLGGGEVYLPPGEYLAGGVIVDARYVNLTGASEASKIKVKNGTVGVQVKQQWCNVSGLRFISQGTKTDGLNTRGLLYEKTDQNSVGLCNCQNLTFDGFSGYGMRITEAINFYLNRVYAKNCTIGISINRIGTGPADFSTTIDFENIYVTDCDTGIYGEYVYRSRFNVIAERCTYGMDMFVGDFTLFRCYFEANTTLGARVRNAACQDLYSYNNNPVTDAVEITFQVGVIPAADRGFVVADNADMTMKRLALLSGFGVDALWLASHGTTANTGLKYGESTVALVRGDNLFNNAAWVPNRLAELQGWDNLKQGYKISGTTAGDNTYGIKQSLSLSTAKQYVIDLDTSTVSGTGITGIRAGSLVVTNGVPFIPTTNGAQDVKCFGVDAGGTPFECYVHAFTIAEVVSDFKQVAQVNDRLTRQKNGRGVSYASAAPSTGRWLQGEIIFNTAPTAGGFVGFVCTASGSPGTWKTFGAISA